ncbi:glycosyltransferase family 1 protein [Synechococcus sp. 1G10]|uniref:glycosyltransferase family 4 protein n=1 Tax=Synechococcus sp. 1G10 TaxID=2025605 RepID=UPI000B98BB13|nr:glycosyltransferase family 1 protein [Synechococcus sp. 1G10]
MDDAESILGPLCIGVPFPSVHPTAGGAYEFQHTVFQEILNRVAAPSSESKVRWIPIAVDSSIPQRWGLDPSSALVFQSPTLPLRIRSAFHRRLYNLRHPWDLLPLSKTLVVRDQIQALRRQVDVLWYLNSSSFTDQLPYVITVWDLQHRLQPFFPEVSWGDTWEARERHFAHVTRKAFLNVTGTQRGSKELQQFFGVDPSRILVNPFPCPESVTSTLQAQNELLHELLLERENFLLYPAQFWSHKNHMAALLALSQLHSQGYKLKLVFTGSGKGSQDAVMKLVSDLKLNDSVVFAGFVERSQLASLYSTALALIYPSFFGPDNLPPLEAMSYGLPAVVAEVPGSHDQYGEAVLFFDPNKPNQLVDAVLQVINDQYLRLRLVDAGKQLLERLTPSLYVDRMQEFLLDASLSLRCSGIIG